MWQGQYSYYELTYHLQGERFMGKKAQNTASPLKPASTSTTTATQPPKKRTRKHKHRPKITLSQIKESKHVHFAEEELLSPNINQVVTSTNEQEATLKSDKLSDAKDVIKEVTPSPSFASLCKACKTAAKEDMKKHGKKNITQLHDPRSKQLLLVKTIKQHLKKDVEILDENVKRDILAGAMFYVKKEIRGTYRLFSADYSLVHQQYGEALKAFDADGKNKATMAFARYFIEHNLPAHDTHPVKDYTVQMIKRAFPECDVPEPNVLWSDLQEKEAAASLSRSKQGSFGFSWFGLLSSKQAPLPTEAKEDAPVLEKEALALKA
jgi:hypothetical protein